VSKVVWQKAASPDLLCMSCHPSRRQIGHLIVRPDHCAAGTPTLRDILCVLSGAWTGVPLKSSLPVWISTPI